MHISLTVGSVGLEPWALETSFTRPEIFQYFQQIRNNSASREAWRLHIAIITAHEPSLHMCLSQYSWPYSKCFKTVEVQCSCAGLELCQLEIAALKKKIESKHSKIKVCCSFEKKIEREHSKTCPQTGSMAHYGRWPRGNTESITLLE